MPTYSRTGATNLTPLKPKTAAQIAQELAARQPAPAPTNRATGVTNQAPSGSAARAAGGNLTQNNFNQQQQDAARTATSTQQTATNQAAVTNQTPSSSAQAAAGGSLTQNNFNQQQELAQQVAQQQQQQAQAASQAIANAAATEPAPSNPALWEMETRQNQDMNRDGFIGDPEVARAKFRADAAAADAARIAENEQRRQQNAARTQGPGAGLAPGGMPAGGTQPNRTAPADQLRPLQDTTARTQGPNAGQAGAAGLTIDNTPKRTAPGRTKAIVDNLAGGPPAGATTQGPGAGKAGLGNMSDLGGLKAAAGRGQGTSWMENLDPTAGKQQMGGGGAAGPVVNTGGKGAGAIDDRANYINEALDRLRGGKGSVVGKDLTDRYGGAKDGIATSGGKPVEGAATAPGEEPGATIKEAEAEQEKQDKIAAATEKAKEEGRALAEENRRKNMSQDELIQEAIDKLLREQTDVSGERKAMIDEMKAAQARDIQSTRARTGLGGMGLTGAAGALESQVRQQAARGEAITTGEFDRQARAEALDRLIKGIDLSRGEQVFGASMDLYEAAADMDFNGDGMVSGKKVGGVIGDGDPSNNPAGKKDSGTSAGGGAGGAAAGGGFGGAQWDTNGDGIIDEDERRARDIALEQQRESEKLKSAQESGMGTAISAESKLNEEGTAVLDPTTNKEYTIEDSPRNENDVKRRVITVDGAKFEVYSDSETGELYSVRLETSLERGKRLKREAKARKEANQ